jgi:hypothetical protein
VHPLINLSQEIDSFHPGPIENDDILVSPNELKKNVFEGIDYVLLPEAAGKMLHDVFGGAEMITRKVKSQLIIPSPPSPSSSSSFFCLMAARWLPEQRITLANSTWSCIRSNSVSISKKMLPPMNTQRLWEPF